MNELARRLAITIGALLIFRLGSQIPVAGLSTMGVPLTSGTLARLSILSLSLIPYLSAAIIIQLVSIVWGRLSALERSGEAGRRTLARFVLILTLLLASFQAFGIASAMQNISGLVAERAEHAADSLGKRGGEIPDVAPGEATADYLDRVVSLTTVIGAVYLVAVSLIPQALVAAGMALPYKIGGGSALIVICTMLDIKTQVRALSLTNPGDGRQ